MDSKLVFIVTHQASDIPIGEIKDGLDKRGLIQDALSDINGKQRMGSFYLDHLRNEGEDPANIRVLIVGKGVPISQLASEMPNLDVVITTDPNYRNIVFVGGAMLVRAHYVPAPNGNPDTRTYAAQTILNYLSARGYKEPDITPINKGKQRH